jgi:hypothetical protein
VEAQAHRYAEHPVPKVAIGLAAEFVDELPPGLVQL